MILASVPGFTGFLLVIVLCFTAVPAGAAAATSLAADEPLPPLLSLQEAVARFRRHGFDLLLAEANVAAAEADEVAAGAVANPTLGASAGKTFHYDPKTCAGCSSIAWTASLSDQGALLNVFSGKRALRVQVAEAALAAAKLTRLDALRTLEFAVKQQYVAAAFAQASLVTTQQAAASASRTLELVAVRYRAGAVSEADAAKVETAKLEADQAVDEAVQNVQVAKATLAFLLGARALPGDFQLDDQALQGAPKTLTITSRDELFRRAIDHRPDLRAAAYQRDSAAAALDLNKRQRWPDVGLFAQYSQEGTGQSAIQPPTVTVGISTPLPLFYQYQGEIDRARANLQAQTVQLSRAQAAIVADIDSALATFNSTQRRVNRMQSRLLDRAKRTRELVQIQYEKGSASLLELLDAQRTFISVSTEYLHNLSDYWSATFALEQAVGMDLQE